MDKKSDLILCFLILKAFFNFTLNIVYKYYRFFEKFFKKNFKFILYKKVGFIQLNLRLILLLVKVNLILKKNCKNIHL